MLASVAALTWVKRKRPVRRPPHILIGITSAQTCLVLSGRLRALREAGFRVTLVSGPGELLDRTARFQGVEAVSIPMQRAISPFADVVAFARLWRLLRRVRPDVTEFSTPKAGLIGTLAARLAGVPRRVYMLRGLKLETARGFKRVVLLAAERLASTCAHRVLCNSASLRAEALALRLASDAKLHMLGAGSSNGIDIERFSPGRSDVRRRFGVQEDAQVLGFVGRLTRDKGIPELIEAFEIILRARPQTLLLLVGWFDASEDALDPDSRERIKTHPNIMCTGFVEDAAPYYRAMDILILPTLREGFPNVALEASATGIPVISTLTTGACDAVVSEVTGLLVPPGIPAAICEAALRLLGDPEESRRMGQAARAWVSANFVDRHILGLSVAFYKDLVASACPSEAVLEPATKPAAEAVID
jgi:glycosyltransferase involved in cell wall biosynthesis